MVNFFFIILYYSYCRYSIYSGSKDNFVINAVTGEVSVAEEANLDIEANGDLYEVSVMLLGYLLKFIWR